MSEAKPRVPASPIKPTATRTATRPGVGIEPTPSPPAVSGLPGVKPQAPAKPVGTPRAPAVAPLAAAPPAPPALPVAAPLAAPTPPAAPVAAAPAAPIAQAGQGIAPKGVDAAELRAIVEAVVFEVLKPAADRMAALEERLAKMEASTVTTSLALAAPALAQVRANVPVITTAPPAAVPSSDPPVHVSVAPSVAPTVPPDNPFTVVSLPPKPAAPLPSVDSTVSFDDVVGFDGGKRRRRITFAFVALVLLGVGGLVASMIASYAK